MTSSGGVNGNNVDTTEGSFINWAIAAQEVDNNRSLINWAYGWRFVQYSCRGLRNGYAEINGVGLFYDYSGGDHIHGYNGSHDHRGAGYLLVASGSLWIGHNEDGTQSLSAYCTMTGFSGQVSTGSDGWALDTIARYTPAPATPVITNVTQTTLTVSFTDGSGGAPITSRQIIMADNPFQTGATTVGTGNSANVTGLTPNKTYYFWAGTYNAAGFSGWSPAASTETIAGARILVSGTWKKATPYTRVSGTWKVARPWTKVMGVWKEDI